jgi:two-component system, NtrC family, sensor kinase
MNGPSEGVGVMNKKGSVNLQRVLDAIPFGISILHHSLQIEWANREAVNHTAETDLSHIRGKLCYKEFLGQEKPCRNCPVLLCVETGRMTRRDLIIELNGQERCFSALAIPFKNETDHPMAIEIIYDITYQNMILEQLRHSNELNRTILDNAPIAIFTIDRDGLFTSMNSVMAEQTGLGDKAKDTLIGRFNWINNPYTIRCGLSDHLKKSLSTGDVVQVWDFPFVDYKGSRTFYMNFKGIPLFGKDNKIEGLLCIIEDTTERAKTLALLGQEAKMAAVGRLVASIAHNLNNPLATIAANAELATAVCDSFQETHVDEKTWNNLKEYHKAIKGEAFRCTNLINDMLKLSRKEGFKWEQSSLNKVLDGVITGINFKKYGIKLVKNLEPSLPEVSCDRWALQQVFLNVINNAIDALDSRPRAKITIKTRLRGADVITDIEDNGIGIPNEIIDKMFEPFFTTKLSKKDLGLGLTFCYEFLKEMGGKVKVKSKPGRGTTFQISLPACAGRG